MISERFDVADSADLGSPEEGVRVYRGRTLADLLPQIRDELGPDAIILREREGLVGGIGGFFAQRFVEVEARAGAPSLDLYDDDGEDELEELIARHAGPDFQIPQEPPAARPLPEAPAAPNLPGGGSPAPRTAQDGARWATIAADRTVPVDAPEEPGARATIAPAAAPPRAEAARTAPARTEAASASGEAQQAAPLVDSDAFLSRLREAAAAWADDDAPAATGAEPAATTGDGEGEAAFEPEAETAVESEPGPEAAVEPEAEPEAGVESELAPAAAPGRPAAKGGPARKPRATKPAAAATKPAATKPAPTKPAGARRTAAKTPTARAASSARTAAAPKPKAPRATATAKTTPAAVVPEGPLAAAPVAAAPVVPVPVPPLPVPPLAAGIPTPPAPPPAPTPTPDLPVAAAAAAAVAAATTLRPRPASLRNPAVLASSAPAPASAATSGSATAPAPASPPAPPAVAAAVAARPVSPPAPPAGRRRFRGALARLFGRQPAPTAPVIPPPRSLDGAAAATVSSDLTSRGTGQVFASGLISAAAAHGSALSAGLREAAQAELARRIVPAPPLPPGGAAIAFVGAGGSGKTLCTASLATAYRRSSTLAVVVIALDSADGGRELSERLEPLGIRVHAGSLDSIREVVQDARDGGLVIVDTPATTPTDTLQMAALAERLEPLGLDAVYVTLPATLGPQAARRALASFGALRPTAIAITHADETDQLGVAIEIAVSHRIPLAYLHAGTDPARAISAADPTTVANHLLP
jgi:flagellar biosynthesis GTPase FlhF